MVRKKTGENIAIKLTLFCFGSKHAAISPYFPSLADKITYPKILALKFHLKQKS